MNYYKIIPLAITTLGISLNIVAQTTIFDPLLPTELDKNRIHLVILSDGYLDNQTERDNFWIDAQDFEDEFFATSPYSEYADYFITYKVFVESYHSGVAHAHSNNTDGCGTVGFPLNQTNGTAFDCSLDNDGLHRLLQSDPIKVTDFTSANFPDVPLLTLVISNNSEFSGGTHWDEEIAHAAGRNTTSTGGFGTAWRDERIAVHEIGHSFGRLLDEYFYEPFAMEAPNMTANQDPSEDGTWGQWLPTNPPSPTPIIGVHDHREQENCFNQYTTDVNGEYTYFPNWHKPSDNFTCKMERITEDYCSVCKEAIIERIHQLVNPIETFSHIDNNAPLPQTPTAPGISGEIFSVDLIEPTHQDMQVKWTLNGTLVATVTSPPWQWSFDCSALSAEPDGTYTLTAEVRDLTDGLVRSHLHPNPPFFDHNTHLWTQSWDIIWNGENENLLIRDFYLQQDNNQPISDVGDEPWQPFPLEGWYFDYTSDIKVTAAQQTPAPTAATFDAIEHVNLDESIQTAYVYVRVKNIGCTSYASADNLHLYASIESGGFSWPGNWEGAYSSGDVGYEITHDGTNPIPATIPELNGGESAVIEIPWSVVDMTPNETATWNPCLLARIEDVTNDPIDATSPASDNLTNWIRFNNNIALRNLTVTETSEFNVEILGGKPYLGGYTYLGNTGSVADTFDIFLQRGLQATGNPEITDEAEVIVYFNEVGWDVSGAITTNMTKGFTRLDSTLFLATSNNASISGIPFPADTVVPVFIGFAFLTQQVGDSTDYVIHLNQRRSSSKDTVRWAQHYQVKRTTRNLFTANAGNDVEILVGDSTTLTASTIGETTIFNWYEDADVHIDTTQSIEVSPNATTTYKVEVIAQADGYKDYDEVTVTVTKGQITSVIPNPTGTTTVVSYKTANITTASLKVVEVNTGNTVDNISITVGTGTKTIDVSGYNTGAHIITLVGDGNDLDTETLVVQ